MPKNSFLSALFSGPKFSIAPIEQNNKGTVRIGEVVPVFATVLNPREGVQLDMAHLVRFLPAKAPVMEGYKVTFDAFAVPYSALGYADRKERDIDDFFNLKENGGLIGNPFSRTFTQLDNILNFGRIDMNPETSLANAFRLGSLCDYINFPSLAEVRKHVRKWLDLNPLAYGNNISKYVISDPDSPLVSAASRVVEFVTFALLNSVSMTVANSLTFDFTGREGGEGSSRFGVPFSTDSNPIVFSDDVTPAPGYAIGRVYYTSLDQNISGLQCFEGAYSLLGYILRNYPAVASYYGFDNFDDSDFADSAAAWATHLFYLEDIDKPLSYDYLQVLYDNYKIDAQSIYDEWFNECIWPLVLYNDDLVNKNSKTLFESSNGIDEPFLPWLGNDDPIDLSYLAAYWKIISDWYINTNIDGSPEDFFLTHCCLLSDEELSSLPARHLNTKPFVRRWPNDIFTSAVPMAQVQNVRIPADGTIPDLREANAYQKLVDIFRNTGNRLRDVIYGIFGITPSAVRSEMSEPIGSESTWIGMQSVLQTSQTTEVSPQAAYAGIGTDSKGHTRILKYVNNDEPTPVIVMVLMSVTQRASYMQGFDRKFFRNSIYDFAVPQLAMIGEQEIQNREVYFDKYASEGVFGFNRRYYDWFYSGSEVHGELRDTLDYWHGARLFDEQPALNSEFIGIESEKDHLQRVFANVSESAAPILYNLSFDGYKTVALPRYIQYEL